MILSALHNYYQRLTENNDEDIAPFGFSNEQVSYALVIDEHGEPLDVRNLQDTRNLKKPIPKILTVPQKPSGGTSNISPWFLWGKTSYLLGWSATSNRADDEHAAFRHMHLEKLAGTKNKSLAAFVKFLNFWSPKFSGNYSFFEDSMIDKNFVIQIDGEMEYLHEKDEARKIASSMGSGLESPIYTCLVTGERGPVARLHSDIKGVKGANKTGAKLVSFQKGSSYESYGKSQGQNAPVSEHVVFAYSTVLNHLLRKDSQQKLELGDTTAVFWAEAGSKSVTQKVEGFMALLLQPPTDGSESDRLRAALDKVSKGRPLKDLDPALEDDTAIYVLGLAPNASRLSVRFWETGSLHSFAERLSQHYRDLELRPLPWKTEPSVWRLLLETVPHREGSQPKSDDIPPQLAGEMIRAILTGRRYPLSLLSNLIMRMRADGDISPLRVALCKAVLVRDGRIANKTTQKEIPMALDLDNTDPGYLLGRLFATLENIQQSALGRDINATIRDRYYGAASATPASIFPVLVRNAQHHLSRLRKDRPGAAVNLEKQINEIVDKLPPNFPKSLRVEAQGRFAIGYYHQSKARFSNQETDSNEGED